ncbi:hypothetical protein BKE38_00240 [Pseudoroseomonas deserti]|uniref:Uncharacterized protein n=1 Tax=Teichococcus deserti TaxID=1817963 RepID=A0A1V2H8Q9_9PROT|nr:hypothetical protein BKE38_00240 [Pseudoroseomonas deserti]
MVSVAQHVVPLTSSASGRGEQQATGVSGGAQQEDTASASAAPGRPRLELQTPVSGRSSSARRAASRSPARKAAMERTCSWPVASGKVGARP